MIKRQTLQQGFTLIELMIVVAIIGILASVAVPAYQDYTQRTQLAGAVAGAQSLKTYVADCYSRTGDIRVCNQNTNGIPANVGPGVLANIQSLAVAGGAITITSTGTLAGVGGAPGANMVITMTPNFSSGVAIQWDMTGNGCSENPTNARGINCVVATR